MRVAVVLGAAVRADSTPSPTLALRVGHAAALWEAGRVERLFLTGGRGRTGPAEAEVARAHAATLGVPVASMAVETRSTHTVGNLAEAMAHLPPGAAVTLVSNRWHLPRAWLAARAMGLDARVSGPRGTLPPRDLARAVLREVAATPRSVWRAWRWRGRGP